MEVEEGLYMEEELFVLGQEDLYMEVLPFSDQTDVVEILLLHLTLGCYAPNNQQQRFLLSMLLKINMILDQ